MKRMLINGNLDEIRVALVESGKKLGEDYRLYDLDIEYADRKQKKANIYSGIITHLEKSLDAAFVDYGAERNGFLPFKEIVLTKEQQQAIERGEKLCVSDVVRKGQQVLVQVEKEERGNKGAALTTYISLPGRCLVLKPNDPDRGISRRIDGDSRQEMKDASSQITLAEGMGIIIRTAGVGRSVEELQWDHDVQLHLWKEIQEVYKTRPAPFLIYQESDIVMRSIRDYLRSDVGEILIDNVDIFERAKKYVEIVRPDFVNSVHLYQESIPLFTRFHIESQIESAYQREVRLPSGGAIVIDHTEALVSIDINSAKSVRGTNIEATALHTNLEAAEEIARQLRLRDIGGLVVIDFIDMGPTSNQREVERCLLEATKMDRARIQTGRISRFGLLEMSRQRLRSSLGESTLLSCPHCHGSGVVRAIESLALSILRLAEENATKDKIKQIRIQAPVEVATYLLNEKRAALAKMEQAHRVHMIIVPNPHYLTPHFKIDTIRQEDGGDQPSYQLAQPVEQTLPYTVTEKTATIETPVVKAADALHSVPEPRSKKHTVKKEGFLTKLWHSLFGKTEAAKKPPHTQSTERPARNGGRGGRNHSNASANRNKRSNQGGLSVRDIARQQGQAERAEQKNAKNNNVNVASANRAERTQESEQRRRERKPRPTAASNQQQDDIVVVKIPAQAMPGKTEFLVTERLGDESTPKATPIGTPVSQESLFTTQNSSMTAPLPVVPAETIAPALPESTSGEDIFAKAQRMLATQLSAVESHQAEPQQFEVSLPTPELNTQALEAAASETVPTSASVVTALANPATSLSPKIKPPHRHQRGRGGKGRRNNQLRPHPKPAVEGQQLVQPIVIKSDGGENS